MALLDDILRWTETLTLWQRDAARRLHLQPQGLSVQDYAQLYDLLKAAHGLPSPQNLTPSPLAAEHLPAALPGMAHVILQTMRDLENVNRIAPGQRLDFCPKGMTVVYGGNASGKSGYARVLKRACRARDQSESIHPDAADPAAQNRIPVATFDVEDEGIAKVLKWNAAAPPPEELSTIAVFDCHCARAYLTEGEAAYMPYGLDIVEDLANRVLPELSHRLDAEISRVCVDRQPFDHLMGDTKVGRVVVALSATTDEAVVRALATLSDEERKRIADLNLALGEADPKAKAQELRLSAGRIKELAERVKSALRWVSDDAILKLRQLDEAAAAAKVAEKLAAETLRSDESLLPGTGEQIWKEMFNAARRFSTEVAYPGAEFPHTGEGAVCPLCQEPLRDAVERLKRFEKYIKDDISKTAALRRADVEAAGTKIQRANLTVGLDDSLAGELALLDDKVAQVVSAYETALDVRRTWMLGALVSHAWDDAPALWESPRLRLRGLAARQLKSARTFARAANQTRCKELKVEYDELDARRRLSGALDALLALVERMKSRAALESCKQDLKTKPISDKSKDLASSAVTDALRQALDDEFKTLGVGHIKTILRDRNDKGKTKYRLVLDLPTLHKPEEILSEGEQRAIAIGAFLAELKIAGHAGGIVFDDPVSSLDHWRRQRVARRLVDEAAQRQVVVLTHDTVFLAELRAAIAASGVASRICHMGWRNDRPGHVSDGLPWDHQGYAERLNVLERTQRAFDRRPWPAYPSDADAMEMRVQYSLLRATIERVVLDVVFNGVVRKYEDWIIVGKLAEVVGLEDGEVGEILRLHKRCCDIADAHDHASERNAPVPSATELGEDIKALKSVVEAIKARRQGKTAPARPER